MDWTHISPADFELLTFHLVTVMGFDDAELIAGSGDEGKDVVAYQAATVPGVRLRTRKWIFQCKRVKNLDKREVVRELANCVGSDVDTWVLVTPFSPSPAFRRWFQSLGQSRAYNFYIHAWWRADLDTYIAHHWQQLASRLPDPLLRSLNEHLPAAADSLSAVTARLRASCTSQMERYAKGKYIPKLYVDRRLQTDVGTFLADEATIARSAKAVALATAGSAQSELSDELEERRKSVRSLNEEHDDLTQSLHDTPGKHYADLAAKTNELESLQAELANAQRIQNPRRRRERLAQATEAIERVRSSMAGSDLRLAERQRELEAALKVARKRLSAAKLKLELSERTVPDLLELARKPVPLAQALPDNHYRVHGQLYQDFAESFTAILSAIDSQAKGEAKHARSRPKQEPPTDDDFLRGYAERIRNRLASIPKLFRYGLVIVARAGGGKTNLLCHLVARTSTTQPTIFLFGKESVEGPNALVDRVERAVAGAFGGDEDPMNALDRLLETRSTFLAVFIDGINESRDLPVMDTALLRLLEWAREHRVKIVITCRDIYWEFFEYGRWEPLIQNVFRDELNRFSPTEYGSALPLYLEHYNVACELADAAWTACQLPLLLRFFCEAYGTPNGSVVNLGLVRDIRLKELFDVYLDRKTEQIRDALGHRNRDAVLRYLFNIVAFMFQNVTTALVTSQLEDATGDSDTSTQQSLYLRLLDEDIIIEEQPGQDAYTRRVGFVYEEFMEYLIARVAVTLPERFAIAHADDLFHMLDKKLQQWVNARGVAEYAALMLIASHADRRANAVRFLQLMSQGGKVWSSAFWSVIAKCPEEALGPDIFNEFHSAIEALRSTVTIRNALSMMSRYSMTASAKLAAAILWSTVLPTVFNWIDLERLDTMTGDELTALADRLITRLESGPRVTSPGRGTFEKVLGTLLPFVNDDARGRINTAMKIHGEPVGRLREHATIRVIWEGFPEQQPLLLNGLFSADVEVRALCADRLRFCQVSRSQMGVLCSRLAAVEKNGRVKVALKGSADQLVLNARRS